MKKDKRILQAIVVLVVVGIGWIHNLDKNSFVYRQLSPVTANWNKEIQKSDTLQVSEGNFYSFTKSIINSGIEHLISNL